MRWFKAWMGLALIALLAAGCIRVEGDITVNDDGTGTVRLLSAFDTEAFGDAGALFGADELCAEATAENEDLSDFPPGATAVDVRDGSLCGTEVTYDLPASTDHSANIAGVFDDGNARLFKQGENWIFETNVDTSEITEGADDDFISEEEFNELLGGASVVFIVDLPGRAIPGQNNATTVGDDGRFEWDIDLLDPPSRLFAQTEPGSGGGEGGGGGLGLILIIAAVVVLAAAAAWWFLTQRKKGSSGSSTPPLGAAGSTPPPAASPPPAGDAPPAVADQAVKPVNPQAQSTVAMPAAGAAQASPEPVWDQTLNAWVIDDPVQGRLVHDAATNSWRPA